MSALVTRQDITAAVQALGVVPGDILLVHSSYKSLGPVEGGPDAVIGGLEDALGKEGTLVMPTLCQGDLLQAYESWYMDKPSDVGFLTEYFRKQIYVYRSNHPTHSVAARGKHAYELTFEHAARGPHYCPFGEYAFADSSPWVKMYEKGAKILFLGCGARYNTMKHMVEGRFVEENLAAVADPDARQALLRRLRHLGVDAGIYMFYNGADMCDALEEEGLVQRTRCGNAELICINAKDSADASLQQLRTHPERWLNEAKLQWLADCKAAGKVTF